MEVEDPLSAKFRTLIEGLMVTTTSEIVKMFSKVLTESRIEISRSWKMIDQLKQQLEECERQKSEAIYRAQMLFDMKREDDEVEVSHLAQQNTNTMTLAAGFEERSEIHPVENRYISLGNANATGPKADQSGISRNKNKKRCASKNIQDSHGTRTGVKPAKGGTSNILDNRPSSSLGKSVTKRRYIKKNKHANNSVARALRDRQHLSMNKRCLCCSLDECYFQASPSRAQHQVPTVYVCRKCEKRFKTDILFKTHKCPMPQSCYRCGQVFTTMQGLSAHSREVSPLSRPLFSCNLCQQTFATQCAWSLHKRIHESSPSEQKPAVLSNTHAINVHKDIKAKLEVRLERISDSQLEAALCKRSYSLQDNTNNSKCTHNGTTAQSLLDSSAEETNVRKVYAVMSTSSCQIQTGEDADGAQALKANQSQDVKDEGIQNSESEMSWQGSTPRKRKVMDCTHDAYNGVFPVEKILKWRNNKGKNEVRVKWMPCCLCGAKFQNTWEPAESFPGFLDDKDEEQ